MMLDKPNRADRLSRSGRAIWLPLVLMVLAAASTFAHDPGLSTADVKLDGDRAAARLTFARGDIEMIAPVDADRDGRITQPEFDAARTGLESLAKESVALLIDGHGISPMKVAVSLDESDAAHFDLEYPPIQGSILTLRSLLIDKLPRGHRQFLELRDAGGNIRAQRMLDASNNSFECDMAAFLSSSKRSRAFWGFLLLCLLLVALAGGYWLIERTILK
jgi:hypothetical protein